MSRGVCATAFWCMAFILSATLATQHGPQLFTERAADVGLHFVHVNGATGEYHLPEIMGAGGAFVDYDLDGDLDVLLLQGGHLSNAARGRINGTLRLFRNDLTRRAKGDRVLRFSDVTETSGLAPGHYGMGVAVGDYDNDGDPDLYVTSFGGNRLYRNDRRGAFTDVTRQSGIGLDDERWSTSASFTDFDADGDLDLFVANYVDFSLSDNKVCTDPTGIRDYCGPLQFRTVPDRLFMNVGKGAFSDISERAGISAMGGAGLGVVGADLTGDGLQDFFVANDGSANQLWVNRGHAPFVDVGLPAGVAFNAEGQPEGSMGIAAGDPDNDGDLDLFVTNITGESHAFYENLGRGEFEDRRLLTKLGALTRPFTGFGTDWFDYDGDGLLDLFVANGAVTIIEALRGESFPFRQTNQLLKNTGGRFLDTSVEAGEAFTRPEVGRGAAFGDVDNDGDVDVLVTNNGGPARLLINESPESQRGITIRLEGSADNAQGLGARIGLVRRGGSVIWRRVHTDGSYLSSSDSRAHFPIDASPSGLTVIVEWLKGPRETWSGLSAVRGSTLTLRQGTGDSRTSYGSPFVGH